MNDDDDIEINACLVNVIVLQINIIIFCALRCFSSAEPDLTCRRTPPALSRISPRVRVRVSVSIVL